MIDISRIEEQYQAADRNTKIAFDLSVIAALLGGTHAHSMFLAVSLVALVYSIISRRAYDTPEVRSEAEMFRRDVIAKGIGRALREMSPKQRLLLKPDFMRAHTILSSIILTMMVIRIYAFPEAGSLQ